MKTSSYYDYTGPGRIGISVGTPRGIPKGYRFYRDLAPTRGMLKMGYRDYRKIYFSVILAKLNPKKVWADLHELAGESEPVLLCFERTLLTADNWCHRTMVADWFLHELGEKVPEVRTSLFDGEGDDVT